MTCYSQPIGMTTVSMYSRMSLMTTTANGTVFKTGITTTSTSATVTPTYDVVTIMDAINTNTTRIAIMRGTWSTNVHVSTLSIEGTAAMSPRSAPHTAKIGR